MLLFFLFQFYNSHITGFSVFSSCCLLDCLLVFSPRVIATVSYFDAFPKKNSILNLFFFNNPWINTCLFYLSEFNSDGEEDLPFPVENGSDNFCLVHCLVLISIWLDVMIFFNLLGTKGQSNQNLKKKILQNLILRRRWRLWSRAKMGNPNQRMMIAVMKRMIHLMMASQAMIRYWFLSVGCYLSLAFCLHISDLLRL